MGDDLDPAEQSNQASANTIDQHFNRRRGYPNNRNFDRSTEIKADHGPQKEIIPDVGTPPEDFRILSVIPTREDLLQSRAFVRPNIVDGAYQDVEHYLDVQFRLLREDYFGPLRDGLHCGHVMEVGDMDNMMLGDRDTVEIRKCPFCRKPIINTRRYKDLVNKIFTEEINPIKTRIYGTAKQIEEKKKELNEKISEFKSKYFTVLIGDKNIRGVYLNLQSVAKTTKKVSKLELDMESICLNILDMIAECYKTYIDDELTQLKTELAKQTEMLCEVFAFKVDAGVMLKVSEQQQKDMRCEIKRMNSIVQLAKLTSHVSYASARNVPEVRSQHDAARAAVFTWSAFDENEAMAALNGLQEAMKVSDMVIKQERDMIVQAIGLKAGHWYKCPNGHFYCIGECETTVQKRKCPECKEKIGG